MHHVQALALTGVERALMLADPQALAAHLGADPAAATTPVDGLVPLLALLRRSTGTPSGVRRCAELLLDAGADPNSRVEHDGWSQSALFDAVQRRDLALIRLLLDRGATSDEDAFYHACEPGVAYLDVLYRPGLENLVIRMLDFEDAAGLRWFLDRGADVNAHGCLHCAIGRDRGADLHDCAFDEDGPTPLDCALWGLQNNRADDGDYLGTVEALLAAGAPTQHAPPTGDDTVDALLTTHKDSD